MLCEWMYPYRTTHPEQEQCCSVLRQQSHDLITWANLLHSRFVCLKTNLCSPGWPQAHRDFIAYASWMLGLKAFATTPVDFYSLIVLYTCIMNFSPFHPPISLSHLPFFYRNPSFSCLLSCFVSVSGTLSLSSVVSMSLGGKLYILEHGRPHHLQPQHFSAVVLRAPSFCSWNSGEHIHIQTMAHVPLVLLKLSLHTHAPCSMLLD